MKYVKKLTYSAICVALSFVCSMIKIMDMPMGGAITLFSMLIISLVGYFYGAKFGFLAAFSFSLVQLFQGIYFIHPVQFLLDYILAFTCFGVSGFFKDKKNGLFIGYILGCVLRFICSALSGYVFFSIYTPEGWDPIIYVIAYNGSYIFIEMILSLIIIFIPQVRNIIERIKVSANS